MGGGKGGGQQTSTQTNNYSPAQLQAQNRVLNTADQYFFGGPMATPQIAPTSGMNLPFNSSRNGAESAPSSDPGLRGLGLPANNDNNFEGSGPFAPGFYSQNTSPQTQTILPPQPTTTEPAFDWQQAAKDRVAPNDPLITQAWNQQEQIANAGYNNPYLSLADATVRGDYLNSNPYIDKTYNRAADQVQNRVLGQFSTAGRTGSGASQDILGSSLGGLANDIYGGNYNNERTRQMQALGMAPMINELRYADSNTLGNVGAQRTAYNQRQIDAPLTALSQYQNLTSGAYTPMGTTSTTPYYSNAGGSMGSLLGMAGGAALAAGTGGAYLPYMMAGGALGAPLGTALYGR